MVKSYTVKIEQKIWLGNTMAYITGYDHMRQNTSWHCLAISSDFI